MARVMLMPRGQASVQLKIVRQRQTPFSSARISSRSSAPSVARVEDEAVRVDDGGRADVLGLAQNDGHDEVHAAQRMHLVVSS